VTSILAEKSTDNKKVLNQHEDPIFTAILPIPFLREKTGPTP